MKKLLLGAGLLLFGLLPVSAPAGDETKKDNTPPPGFTALFNGKDLTGWQGLIEIHKRAKMTKDELAAAHEKANARILPHWKVVDGMIAYDGKANNLQTAKDYADIELYVDWKIGRKGDSGIYLRGNPQVQIWDNKEGSGGLYNNQPVVRLPKSSIAAVLKDIEARLDSVADQEFKPEPVFSEEIKKFGPLILKHAERNRKASGAEPLVFADNPPGQWNTFHIIMKRDKVTVKLNGTVVVDNKALENYWERGKPLPAKGPIELQHHGNPLWFKNIYIKEYQN